MLPAPRTQQRRTVISQLVGFIGLPVVVILAFLAYTLITLPPQ